MAYSRHRHILDSARLGKFPRRAGYLRKWAALSAEDELPLLGHEELTDGIPTEATQEEDARQEELAAALWAALWKMPNRRAAAVVVLHFFGDLTLTEIGKILGVCRARASNLEDKALHWLRQYGRGKTPLRETRLRIYL